jgi:hypothetical protein
MGAAVRAAVLADPSCRYGYAVLSGGETEVHVFPDGESLRRAMAAIYARNGKWQYPLSWEGVLFFEPEEPLRLYMVIELDDDESEADS